MNDVPTSNDALVTATEDTVYTFKQADFPYTDVEDFRPEEAAETPDQARQPATEGTFWFDADDNDLLDNGEVVMAADFEVDTIDIPKLKFLPDLDFGNDYSAFVSVSMTVRSIASKRYTMTINVAAVNDLPTSADDFITATEDVNLTFLAGHFPYADVDGNLMAGIRVDSAGKRHLGSTKTKTAPSTAPKTVTNGTAIALADILKPTWLSDLHENGNAHTTFEFEVFDGTHYSEDKYVMNIHVTSVNDAPTSADTSITINEDTILIFEVADFPYLDLPASPNEDGSLTQICFHRYGGNLLGRPQ